MLSKDHISGSKPIAFDTGDEQLVFYKKEGNGPNRIKAKGSFEPWVWGDSLIFVAGKRGSGKSTFANLYIKSYTEATDGKVFLISRFEKDPSIKLPERSLHIPIEDIKSVEIDDLSNSLVVFDDIANAQLTAQQIRQLYAFLHDVIQNSRHYNTKVLITSHQVCDYSRTREVLNECSAVVVYPQHANRYQIERALKIYFGMNKEQVDEIMNIEDSRWVYVNTVEPKFVMTQKEIWTYK